MNAEVLQAAATLRKDAKTHANLQQWGWTFTFSEEGRVHILSGTRVDLVGIEKRPEVLALVDALGVPEGQKARVQAGVHAGMFSAFWLT